MALTPKTIVGTIVFLGLGSLLFSVMLAVQKKEDWPKQCCFGSHCFRIEISRTSEERARGLMFRKALPKNEGMLFVFPREGIYSFWMKNMLIPLDIIWLSEDMKVVFIRKYAEPCNANACPSIYPDQPAKYVLEVNAGMADAIGLSKGSTLILKY